MTLTDLSSFDLPDNVPAFQLTDAKMENIEKYVRDLGGGLLVIGGSQSYGAGGYYRTAPGAGSSGRHAPAGAA